MYTDDKSIEQKINEFLSQHKDKVSENFENRRLIVICNLLRILMSYDKCFKRTLTSDFDKLIEDETSVDELEKIVETIKFDIYKLKEQFYRTADLMKIQIKLLSKINDESKNEFSENHL